ncbi:MAG TPA: thioredoxin [Streptosporangiaceae bacterium]|nr:thioredoxin [Streptosporangiaceae bacterium]
MDAVKSVTDSDFDAVVMSSPRPVIVEYWAPWCGPCRQVGPVLEAIAAENADRLDVVKLNIDENPQVVQRFGIMLAPTIDLVSGGQVVKQVIGAKSKAALMREFEEFI